MTLTYFMFAFLLAWIVGIVYLMYTMIVMFFTRLELAVYSFVTSLLFAATCTVPLNAMLFEQSHWDILTIAWHTITIQLSLLACFFFGIWLWRKSFE